MPMINAPKCLVVLLMVHCGAMSSGQDSHDIAEMQRTLAEVRQKLTRIQRMLPVYEKDSQDFAKLSKGLTSAAEEMKRAKERVDVIEAEILQRIQAEFGNLKPCDEISWKVAPRHKAFFAALPEDPGITSSSGSTIIKKTGNPVDRKLVPPSAYHVCPDFALTAGDRVMLRLSIPGPPSRGSSPVPYFGFRDAEGNELVLGELVADFKEHVILVQCLGSDGFALIDGNFCNPLGPVDELVPPLYVFFHMNDASELKIHELKLSEAASPD